MRSGRAGEREIAARTKSLQEAPQIARLCEELEDTGITDVLNPDSPFEADPYESTAYIDSSVNGLHGPIIYDETGTVVSWPWETGPTRCTGGKRRRHRLDGVIRRGLLASTASGDMGANSTGVRHWRKFVASENTVPGRPMDANVPLRVRLEEEWLCMRYIAYLVEIVGVLPNTAASYFGQVQGWHAKEYGVKLCAGMKLGRLPAMLKGLRREMGDGGRAVRRGISPQALGRAMAECLDPNDVEHANIRAALALGFQGLLRGAEFTTDGRFSAAHDMTRADLVDVTADRLVVMMRPCKNMQHLNGKTVPLIIGAGGTYVDAVREVQNLLRVDPVPCSEAASTPMFRMGRAAHERRPMRTEDVRNRVKAVAARSGNHPAEFGAHSLRIGGATALFAAGAEPHIIRTMGRWSSDCYRLYVRACFSQTLKWSKTAGSQVVDDVAQEFAEVDCY